MRLVTCSYKYWQFVLDLRNDKRVKENFINQEIISEQSHYLYMLNNHEFYNICLNDDDVPVGYIGCVDGDIRICVHPEHQRRGYAEYMLNNLNHGSAKIKIENTGSIALFEKCGFEKRFFLLERK